MAIYLEIPGIKGNVTADGYKDQIQLDSVSFGVSRGITMTPGAMSNREATRPSLSEVSISKTCDSSVINLFKEASVGSNGKDVKIHFVRTGADKVVEYMTYELFDCLISSYSMSCPGEGEAMENLTLSYSKVEISYTNTDKDNANGTAQRVSYDLTQARGG
ncbi:type VI secretion system tube protein Hcp [Aliikangiella marina]|uniref:Type VI secretion system tube protein Hcp n=1 Tax=Aliikangiella marina TaxID=1712262 RepID=A0A545TGM6_9GAMM|nr:type VI secretion system tube protein Hcp [Aliikangiella marina]TQV76389.1 type VI secretion system tube protein Hcp [Aliikangiella marina]